MNLVSEQWTTFYVTARDLRNMEQMHQAFLDKLTQAKPPYPTLLKFFQGKVSSFVSGGVVKLLGGGTPAQVAVTLTNLTFSDIGGMAKTAKANEIEVIRSGRNVAGHVASIIEKNKYKQIEITFRTRKYYNPELGNFTSFLYGNPNEKPSGKVYEIKRAQLSNGVWQGK